MLKRKRWTEMETLRLWRAVVEGERWWLVKLVPHFSMLFETTNVGDDLGHVTNCLFGSQPTLVQRLMIARIWSNEALHLMNERYSGSSPTSPAATKVVEFVELIAVFAARRRFRPPRAF
jgi:hypothetical protein